MDQGFNKSYEASSIHQKQTKEQVQDDRQQGSFNDELDKRICIRIGEELDEKIDEIIEEVISERSNRQFVRIIRRKIQEIVNNRIEEKIDQLIISRFNADTQKKIHDKLYKKLNDIYDRIEDGKNPKNVYQGKILQLDEVFGLSIPRQNDRRSGQIKNEGLSGGNYRRETSMEGEKNQAPVSLKNESKLPDPGEGHTIQMEQSQIKNDQKVLPDESSLKKKLEENQDPRAPSPGANNLSQASWQEADRITQYQEKNGIKGLLKQYRNPQQNQLRGDKERPSGTASGAPLPQQENITEILSILDNSEGSQLPSEIKGKHTHDMQQAEQNALRRCPVQSLQNHQQLSEEHAPGQYGQAVPPTNQLGSANPKHPETDKKKLPEKVVQTMLDYNSPNMFDSGTPVPHPPASHNEQASGFERYASSFQMVAHPQVSGLLLGPSPSHAHGQQLRRRFATAASSLKNIAQAWWAWLKRNVERHDPRLMGVEGDNPVGIWPQQQSQQSPSQSPSNLEQLPRRQHPHLSQEGGLLQQNPSGSAQPGSHTLFASQDSTKDENEEFKQKQSQSQGSSNILSDSINKGNAERAEIPSQAPHDLLQSQTDKQVLPKGINQ